jgi:hypothetical protein
VNYREELTRIAREGERASRKLAKLNDLPDFNNFPNGAIVAVSVGYPTGDPYTYIGHKVKDRWYFTGTGSPNNASVDDVMEWLVKGPRRVYGTALIAELEVLMVPAVDLTGMLAQIWEFGRIGPVCADPSCGCSGTAHP